MESVTKPIAPLFRLNTPRFNSPSSLSLLFWSVVLRIALLAGYPVVLIGACRTGKTLLLKKLTPGNVIDKREDAMRIGKQCSIAEYGIPDGRYSIDECQLIEPASGCRLMLAMAAKRRAFCLSGQRYSDLSAMVDAYNSHVNAKTARPILVVVGGDFNPAHILLELPR